MLLTVPYRDFQGQSQLGHLIVAEKVAADLAAAFKEIYDSNSFRIERMELIDKYGGDDDKSMAANNTSAFNCRPVTAGLNRSLTCRGSRSTSTPCRTRMSLGIRRAR